jgi:hypothetical protein
MGIKKNGEKMGWRLFFVVRSGPLIKGAGRSVGRGAAPDWLVQDLASI